MNTHFSDHTSGTTEIAPESHANLNGDPVASPLLAANDPVYERSQPSLETQQAYLKDVQRLLSGHAVIISRRTSYRYRAAWVWFLQNTMNDELTASVRARLTAALEQCPPGSDQLAENHGRESIYQGVQIRSQGKRSGLHKLPQDWRELLIDSADDAHLFISLCILSLTGLRPSELQRGVTILWQDGLLAIGIMGSKVRADKGQPWRVLRLDAHHSWAVGLIDALELEQGAAIGFRYAKAKLQRQMRGMAEICFPSVSPESLPSPLSARHQFSSDMKRSGVSRQVIAAALGHASERTSEIYGRKSLGRSGKNGLINASAPREIRLAQGLSHIVSVTSESLDHSLPLRPTRRTAAKKSSPSGPGGF